MDDSKHWNNEILNTKKGLHYTRQTDAVIDQIGHCWLRVIHCGVPIDKITNYTVLLALHLRAPTVDMEHVFDVRLQRPTLEDYVHPVTGIKIEEPDISHIEEELGFVAVCLRQMGREDQEAAALKNLANAEEIDKIKMVAESAFLDSNMKVLEKGINELLTEKQRAAFYAFLAAVTCRLTGKAKYYVKKEWESQTLLERFSAFYSVSLHNIQLPSPNSEILEKIENQLQPGYNITLSVYKAFLGARDDPSITSMGNVKGVLDYTLLMPTAMHGLGPISYCYRAAKHANCHTIEEFLSKITSIYTTHSIKSVFAFIQTYINLPSDFKDKNWFYWARIIDHRCFSELGFHDNRNLGGVCAYIIEGGTTGPAWNTLRLKEIDMSYRNKLKSVCSHIPRKEINSSIEDLNHPEDIFIL